MDTHDRAVALQIPESEVKERTADPGWARISVGQYAATHIKDFILDLERSIPQTQTVDEAMEFATVTKELALHLLRIALEARDRAELLIERKQF